MVHLNIRPGYETRLTPSVPQVNNAGCSFVPDSSDTATYGDTFNAVGGGVYAMEWTAEDIRIWHWPRQSIPADVVDKQPDPASWGLPTALFGTSTCDPDTYFRNMSIVIQTVSRSSSKREPREE